MMIAAIGATPFCRSARREKVFGLSLYDIDKALEKPLATGEKTLSPRRLPARLPEI